MKDTTGKQMLSQLDQLCTSVRAFVTEGAFDAAMELTCRAMERFPHAPHPHNLMGIVLEKLGDHSGAMKHFRAAWALDPGYVPANHNLYVFGTLFPGGKCAFEEKDVPPERESTIQIVYDARGIGRAVYKAKIEYDARGIGRVVRR